MRMSGGRWSDRLDYHIIIVARGPSGNFQRPDATTIRRELLVGQPLVVMTARHKCLVSDSLVSQEDLGLGRYFVINIPPEKGPSRLPATPSRGPESRRPHPGARLV